MSISSVIASQFTASTVEKSANGKELPQDYAVSDKKDASKLVQTAEEAKAAAKAKNDKAIADFNAYMEKSPMEKYVEAWLEQHGISKEKFESMTPEEQKNILTQIKEDFEREAKLAAEKKGQFLNIVA